jgi:hypothetical protein
MPKTSPAKKASRARSQATVPAKKARRQAKHVLKDIDPRSDSHLLDRYRYALKCYVN